METQNLSEAESLFLRALEANNEGKLEVAQLYLEMTFSLKESIMLIDAHLFYIKILMGKRNWSLNQLRENKKRISEHIDFVRQNLIPAFDERQRKLFSELSMEFIRDFTYLVNHIERKSEYEGDYFYENEDFIKLQKKYFLQF